MWLPVKRTVASLAQPEKNTRASQDAPKSTTKLKSKLSVKQTKTINDFATQLGTLKSKLTLFDLAQGSATGHQKGLTTRRKNNFLKTLNEACALVDKYQKQQFDCTQQEINDGKISKLNLIFCLVIQKLCEY